MATTIRRLITLTLTNENGDNLSPQQEIDAAFALETAIQQRLFGEGFLPDDVEADSWAITPTE